MNKKSTDEMSFSIKDALLNGNAKKLEADLEFDNLTTIPKEPANGKVAAYARHSMSASLLDEQAAEVVAYAEKVGDIDVELYKEIAGPYDETYEQQRIMLDKIKAGEYKRIYLKSRDRLSKDPEMGLQFAKAVVDSGVEIIEL